MIQNIVSRHMKMAAGKPYLSNMGLTKSKAMAGEAAMLYSIEAGSNKSKYYEMIIVVADDGTAQLIKANGRLGSPPRMGRPEQYRDLDSAKRALAKVKRSKINGRSAYKDAFDSKHHKTPDGKQLPKGQYPVGLATNPGSWKNQDDIHAMKPTLKRLVQKINEAVADADNADMNSVLDDLQAANALAMQLGRSSMAEEIKKKIKAPLARLQGGGRHRVDPIKVVREMKSLSRYISKQLSMTMTASIVDRTASKTEKLNGMEIVDKTRRKDGFFAITLMNPKARNKQKQYVVALWDGKRDQWERAEYDLSDRDADKAHKKLKTAGVQSTKIADMPSFQWPLGAMSDEDSAKIEAVMQRAVGRDYTVWRKMSVGATTDIVVSSPRMDWEDFAADFKGFLHDKIAKILKRFDKVKRVNVPAVQRTNAKLLAHVRAIKTAKSAKGVRWVGPHVIVDTDRMLSIKGVPKDEYKQVYDAAILQNSRNGVRMRKLVLQIVLENKSKIMRMRSPYEVTKFIDQQTKALKGKTPNWHHYSMPD